MSLGKYTNTKKEKNGEGHMVEVFGRDKHLQMVSLDLEEEGLV